MIRQRHPEVADMMISCLSERSGLRHLDAAAACREELLRTDYSAPEWRAVSTAQPHFIADRLPGVVGIPAEGWQHDASSFTEKRFFESSILPGCSRRACVTAVPRRSSGGSPVHCSTLSGVAVLSTALATTVHVVRGQGCWGDVVLLWSQQLLGCAREAGARVSTNVFLRPWTSWESALRTNDGSKSSPKVSQFSTGFSWRLTPPSCRQSAQMVNLIDVSPRSMVPLWRWPDSAK